MNKLNPSDITTIAVVGNDEKIRWRIAVWAVLARRLSEILDAKALAKLVAQLNEHSTLWMVDNLLHYNDYVPVIDNSVEKWNSLKTLSALDHLSWSKEYTGIVEELLRRRLYDRKDLVSITDAVEFDLLWSNLLLSDDSNSTYRTLVRRLDTKKDMVVITPDSRHNWIGELQKNWIKSEVLWSLLLNDSPLLSRTIVDMRLTKKMVDDWWLDGRVLWTFASWWSNTNLQRLVKFFEPKKQ